MKIILKCLLVSLIIAVSGNTVAAQSKADSPQSGLLWEVGGKGLKQPSYLFGTYHLIGKNFLDTLPGIMRQFSKSNMIVGEVVIGDEMSMAQKLMPMMMLQNNTLDKILTEKEFAETDSFLKAKAGMDLNTLKMMKPASVQLIIVSMLAPKDISPTNPALDMYFQNEAKAANKAVAGLETIEEQGDILFNTPIERQKDMLLKTIRESARMTAESNLLYEKYKKQDLDAIEKSFLENTDYTAAEMDELLAKRNKNWVQKMPEMMSKGSVFFAVGAGHLVGDEGLINLLREAGYTLKPLSLR